MELENCTAVITGAGSGVGEVIARHFAHLGARVVVGDVVVDRAESVARSIRAVGGKAVGVGADVCRATDRADLVAQAVKAGSLNVLINNAGGWGSAREQFPEAPEAEWAAVLELNLRAPMALAQQCLPVLRQAGGGAIVNVASSAGWDHGAYASPEYAAAKAGLIRFTTALADLRRTHAVRVNCLVPNWIGLDRAYDELAAMSPAERACAPDLIPPAAVADAVARLATDETLNGRIGILVGTEPLRLLDLTG
jgi:NAD(P)-dependent dehydrogenase (short-subunit alcohol dehydrogenase family)